MNIKVPKKGNQATGMGGMKHEQPKKKNGLTYLPKGIIENAEGKVAGMWIRKRNDNYESILFDKPVNREKRYRIERKNITIDGKMYANYPVKVFIESNDLTHWDK